MKERKRRFATAFVAAILVIAGAIYSQIEEQQINQTIKSSSAGQELTHLKIKGRAPKTGYSRDQFGPGWDSAWGCDTRNRILKRDLKEIIMSDDGCRIEKGSLDDPYTGKRIAFRRGKLTSSAVQIDHVVALSDAWQKGAQQLSPEKRIQFANDGLNLLAVDGPANMQKGDGDAATWLPANKSFRCQYVTRQISVKKKYSLWITQSEYDAMKRIIATCAIKK